jgi:hypothetical protein
LQAAAVALHRATQAPDNPQFCEHENLAESQFVTHSFGAWAWASLKRIAPFSAWHAVTVKKIVQMRARYFIELLP